MPRIAEKKLVLLRGAVASSTRVQLVPLLWYKGHSGSMSVQPESMTIWSYLRLHEYTAYLQDQILLTDYCAGMGV